MWRFVCLYPHWCDGVAFMNALAEAEGEPSVNVPAAMDAAHAATAA